MALFLVTGTIVATPYMGRSSESKEVRIVEADSEVQACGKFGMHFTSMTEEYETYYSVRNCVAHEAIR